MKNIKCKNYNLLLNAEYVRLKRNANKPSPESTRIKDMEELLKQIDQLKSPQKEDAFLAGIIELNHLPAIAA